MTHSHEYALKAEIDRLKKDLESRDDPNKDKVKNLQEQNENLKMEIEELKKSENRIYGLLAKNKNLVNELREENENMKAQSYRKDDALDQAKTKIENLKSELSDLNKKLKVSDFGNSRLKISALGLIT